MWTVGFKDYLKFEGVKDSIRYVKQVKKEGRNNASSEYGLAVEEGIMNTVSSIPGFTVKSLPAQLDVGFGADMQVLYKEEDKNYSFYVDITSTSKDTVQYLRAAGDTTDDINEAFCYKTEHFDIRFGLKERHMRWFFYDKPVVVLHIQDFNPSIEPLAQSHLANIGAIMVSLNKKLVEEGYGARASQKVRPNISRFKNDYNKYKKEGK